MTEKIKNIAGWGLLIVIIIAGIWILADDSNNVSEPNLTANISQPERNSVRTPLPLENEAKDEPSHISNYVYVKYRSDKVDIAHPRFEYLNTAKSSWVKGAWYYNDNQYMVINLSGNNYHYCGMTRSAWNSFKSASSFGTHYNSYIKGRYDCRIYPVPKY